MQRRLNPMGDYEIQFPWLARFKDGSELPQFSKDGSENLFRKVLDRQDDLATFRVGPVTVDLYDGSFLIHGIKLTGSCEVQAFDEWGIDERLPKRLIYFRRPTREMDIQSLREVRAPYVVYGVGWQATIEGRNVKHVVFIHPNGDIVFS